MRLWDSPDRMPVWAWLLGWAWTLPNTLLGLTLATLGGAKLRRITSHGVFEYYMDKDALLDRWWFAPFPTIATTFGAVVLYDRKYRIQSATLRTHELHHVVQYFVLGPLFLPAYGIAALVAKLRGGHPHEDNYFERQARARVAERLSGGF